jgi:hypothetical protein
VRRQTSRRATQLERTTLANELDREGVALRTGCIGISIAPLRWYDEHTIALR